MQETLSPVSLVLIVAVNTASLLTLFLLFRRHIAGLPLVPYQPRRRVPWGIGIALAALVFPLVGVAVVLISIESPNEETTVIEQHVPELVSSETSRETRPAEFIEKGATTIVAMLLFVVVVATILRLTGNADASDLGLPVDTRQLGQDIGLGAVACVASILPTLFLQYILTLLVQPEHEHPMIEEFQAFHTPGMMIVGMLMVTVAAPVFEEFSFRLLFQGWLEKWEDQTIGLFATERSPEPSQDETLNDVEITQERLEGLETVVQQIDARSCPGVLPNLPHGWLPVLVSSVLFGLAHLGHGVSPIPLVLFGMVLGYLYQRTHRLLPSIVAHSLFNAYSMTLLWLNL